MHNSASKASDDTGGDSRLSDRYMITGYFEHKETLFYNVSSALDQGIRLIQFRAHWLEELEYLEFAYDLSELIQTNGRLIIKGDCSLLAKPWCHGLHLTSRQLALMVKPEKRHAGQLLVASCHNELQIRDAEAMAVDFITLSPVKVTQSHPEVKALGFWQAAKLTEVAAMPVFWLGGMAESDLEKAQQLGAKGIAAIGAFWGY